MRAALTALLAAISLPAGAQEICAYVAKDGLIVEWWGGDELRTTTSDGVHYDCTVTETETENLRRLSCPSFGLETNMWMMADTIDGEAFDILLIPPNVLYYSCAPSGDVG